MSGRKKDNKRGFLKARAYASIKNAIITGQLETDQRLIEEALASDLGISRTPIREALQQLEKEGLILRRSASGFAVKGVSEEDVEEILEVQRALESYACHLAASRITDAEITSLVDLIRVQEDCLKELSVEKFIWLDSEFHDAIHKAAKNDLLYNNVRRLRDHMERYRVIIFRSRARLSLSVKEHKEMVALLQAKKTKQIGKLIGRHIIRGKDVIKKHIAKVQEGTWGTSR